LRTQQLNVLQKASRYADLNCPLIHQTLCYLPRSLDKTRRHGCTRPRSASLLYDAKFVLPHENTKLISRRWHMAQQPSAAGGSDTRVRPFVTEVRSVVCDWSCSLYQECWYPNFLLFTQPTCTAPRQCHRRVDTRQRKSTAQFVFKIRRLCSRRTNARPRDLYYSKAAARER
jgi:hypothetical protein